MARNKKRTPKSKTPAASAVSAETLRLTQTKLELSYLREIVAKTASQPLSVQEQTDLSASLETLAWVMSLIENKNATLTRLRRALFGNGTESMEKLLATLLAGPSRQAQEEGRESVESPPPPAAGSEAPTEDAPEAWAEGAPEASDGQQASTTAQGDASASAQPSPNGKLNDKPKKKGHGRHGADRFTGAKQCLVAHETLLRGQVCPECGKGKLYPLAIPAVLVRIEGLGPLVGTVYELERLRCNGCLKVFTAKPPEGVGTQKYDESATAMVALLRYGCGMPFHRLSRLQTALGIPLPSSTAFEQVEAGADALEALYDALVWEAAQGSTLYNDDTWVRILTPPVPLAPEEGQDRSERTGLFTTGVLSEVEGRQIALYFTGRQHAGENLKEVLLRRASGLRPPVQMSDALSRNAPKGLETLASTCLAHARRNFVDISESFPDEVRYVLEQLGQVYHREAEARRQGMSDLERLAWHQARSETVMSELKTWMDMKLRAKEVEPNSGLGQAMNFMLKRWETFTVFLRLPGAPLDNNGVERALKRAILHRKNSMFFKTWNGARVGDLYMSLVHTCELTGQDPFAYLVAVLKNAAHVDADPSAWLPWTWQTTLAAMSLHPPAASPSPGF